MGKVDQENSKVGPLKKTGNEGLPQRTQRSTECLEKSVSLCSPCPLWLNLLVLYPGSHDFGVVLGPFESSK